MGFTLYDAVVPSWLQLLDALSALLDKAEAFCAERGLDPADILEARLSDDMLPFSYQVKSAAVHSLGAIEGVRRGEFNPDQSALPDSFAGLKAILAKARDGLAALDPGEVDGFVGRDVDFAMGDFRMAFVAENFLLSFSNPNFYFHVTTAYALLRAKGLSIGKRDFVGRPRIKQPA